MATVRLGLGLLFVLLLVAEASRGVRLPGMIRQVTQSTPLPLEMYVDELPQTTKLYAYSDLYTPVNLTVGMYQTTTKFHRDLPPTTIFAYGTSQQTASFPGPTIVALKGVPTYVRWENHLPLVHILPVDNTIPDVVAPDGGVPTVVHLHGGTIAPDSDGSAFAWFTADFKDKGPVWTQANYTYPNVQHAGNLLYHDHALGLTRINLLAGLLGAYVIVDPPVEADLNLPSGDEFDRHLVIADRRFRTDGSIYMNHTGVNPNIHPVWQPEYFGDAITVNGKVWPYLAVQRRKYRFRIINASNARYLNLSLSTGLPFTVIGSDTSYLPAPVTTNNIVLSVAEIFDVVVDFSLATGDETELSNSAPYPYPGGTVPGPLDSKVMKFIISPLPVIPADPYTIPTALVSYEAASLTDVSTTRYITLYEYFSLTGQTTHLNINALKLEDPATETPVAGSTELWNVINLTEDNHPLHLHLAQFQAINMQQIVNVTDFKNCMNVYNDAVYCNIGGLATGKTDPVPEYEKTWKNVVKLPPSYKTSVIVKFKLLDSNLPYPFNASIEPGYVYHCHILDHEDNAMIRPLKLLA